MSFTFTPVVAGNPVLATDFRDAFDKLQLYINGGVVAGDITGPFQKHHIMKGSYEPLPNTFNFVSGVCGSQVFTTIEEKLSWLAGAATQPTGGVALKKFYPNTSISFYVERESMALFQFFACPLVQNFDVLATMTVANENESVININVDGVTYVDSRNFTHEEWLPFPTAMRQREFFTGFQMIKLGVGWHHIGLEGFTRSNNIFLINWGFTLECWHDDNVLSANGTAG
jgi:hypothetical protein